MPARPAAPRKAAAPSRAAWSTPAAPYSSEPKCELSARKPAAVLSARTNDSGSYTLPYLLPGVYNLTAEFTGFKKTDRADVAVRVNDVLTIEFRLEVGNATESVEVSGGAPLIEASNVTLGQVVEERQIKDLPLQAGNANELVLLTPGVVNSTNLRQRKSSFNSASSQFTTNGNALYSNEYTIDGVPDTFFNGGSNPLIAFQLPQNSVAEFKVQTSSFDSTVGHTPGAVLNTITKSGTNEFHGELHENMINAALDASTFFQNASGGAKPEYQDNRYGAALGGPVRIPKLYNGTEQDVLLRRVGGQPVGQAHRQHRHRSHRRRKERRFLRPPRPRPAVPDLRPCDHAVRRQRAIQPDSVSPATSSPRIASTPSPKRYSPTTPRRTPWEHPPD